MTNMIHRKGEILWRVPTILVCIFMGISCKGPEESAQLSKQQLDVILITLDTTRADHLACYGYSKHTTPYLDGLASRGVLFNYAMAQASVTPVSHASIMTGLNPYTHGLRVMHGRTRNRLDEDQVTMAEVLKQAGYKTAAFVSAFPVTERFGLHQGFDHFDSDFLLKDPEELVSKDGVVSTAKNQRRADHTTDRALAWLDRTSSPFFLWLHYFDPHDPQIVPPRGDIERIGVKPVTQSEPDLLRALYDMEITFMDEQIGRVLEWLARRGPQKDSIVVVVADHGEGLGDHDWWTHGILYQEQIRVPLIIYAPQVMPGTRVDFLVRTIDVAPTIFELANIADSMLPSMEGTSLEPLLHGGGADPRHDAYSDSLNMISYGFTDGIRDVKQDMLLSLVQGKWKYIHHINKTEESELFRLDQDPGELNNIIQANPTITRRMRRNLSSRNSIPQRHFEDVENMSAEDLERLRTLGYIGDQ